MISQAFDKIWSSTMGLRIQFKFFDKCLLKHFYSYLTNENQIYDTESRFSDKTYFLEKFINGYFLSDSEVVIFN